MAKQMPNYMVYKIERMSSLMDTLKQLNFELEEWLESEGLTDYGFDYTNDYRWNPGYCLIDGFIERVNEDLARR